MRVPPATDRTGFLAPDTTAAPAPAPVTERVCLLAAAAPARVCLLVPFAAPVPAPVTERAGFLAAAAPARVCLLVPFAAPAPVTERVCTIKRWQHNKWLYGIYYLVALYEVQD